MPGDLRPELDEERLFREMLELGDDLAPGLAILRAALAPERGEIVEEFYLRMRRHPEAMAIFRGGEGQIARQREALGRWLDDFLAAPRDGAYLERHRRLGTMHLNAGVDERLVIAALGWLREIMTRRLDAAALPEGLSPDEARDLLGRLLDHDLGLMLNAYWSDLHDRARRVDRLALIGQFTAAINHEIRNPLGVIGTSVYLLRRHLEGAGPGVEAQLGKIERNVARATGIVSGLLDLLRVREPERRETGVGAFLRELVSELDLPEDVRLQLVPGEELRAGVFDPDQVRMVVENLVRNAVEALGGPGTIEMTWRSDDLGTVISVRDDGPGVPEEIRARVFEPLQSTKSFGTGLGLTLAKAIVESHGGSLELSSGLSGRGAGFEIRLPHFLRPTTRF